jgi:uncharacterized protein
MAIQYLPITWDVYHSYALKLAAALLSGNHKVDEIVAISRGGLTFGHVLSDFLRIPIWTITIQSYTDIQTQGEIKITGKLQNSIENKHILLVDDVADSGKTLVRAVEYLHEAGAKKATTMTMFFKPHSVFRPDFFAKETKKWILFPYEPTEMIILITQNLQKQKKSKAEIQTFLNNLGYTTQQIAFTRRHHAKLLA